MTRKHFESSNLNHRIIMMAQIKYFVKKMKISLSGRIGYRSEFFLKFFWQSSQLLGAKSGHTIANMK